MRRTTLSEKHKAVALLVALGQLTYQEIAKQAGIHHNSVTNWLKDERVQALVREFQQDIQDKLATMAVESTHRKNGPLIMKAVDKLEQMLEAKSPQRQLDAIQFLLGGPLAHQDAQKRPQGEQPSLIRLRPEVRSSLKSKESQRGLSCQ
jgi:hypothetical protein